MRKHAFKYTMILAFLGMTITLPAGCSNPNDGKLPNADNGEVNEPEVNKPNANTNNNNKEEHELFPTTGFIDGSKDENKELEDVIDEEGNLLMPFDEAFPNMMNEVIYDENSILVKAYDKDIKVIYDNLSRYGVINYEYVNTSEKGISWYRLDLKGRTSKALINKFRSVEKTALQFDLNYVLDKNSLYVEETGSTTNNSPEVNTTDCNIKGALGNEFFKEQYYFRDYGLADTYKYITDHGIAEGGEGTVVAVIDTGVDLDHVDLKNNIYSNSGEIADNNIDDDLNGYIDDVHGWNFVDNNNNPDDDHGHGTHVAGIIAADNNLVGTLGIAYNAKIMPVKAADQSGFLTAERIAKAVEYAYMNGADVINMSFGGSYVSLAEQDALQHAYLKASLVAAAGNDSYIDEPISDCSLKIMPSYPACYSFVVGVMSVDPFGVESPYTNIDGEYYSTFEYELYAPGESIYSTFPGGYAKLTGTSMAAPIVSGIIALLRAQNPNKTEVTNKFLSGQICGTANRHPVCCDPEHHGSHHIPSIVNAFDAFTKAPRPDVNMIDYKIFDLPEYNQINNNNGAFDAGETVYIAPILRNRWGLASDAHLSFNSLNENGIESKYIKLSNVEIDFGNIGTYSSKDYLIYSNDKTSVVGCDVGKSLRVDVKKTVPNGVFVNINCNVTCKNGLDTNDVDVYSKNHNFVENLVSGFTLPKMINNDMTLTKDNFYIVPELCTINENVVVNVEPGTTIQFGNGKLEGFGGTEKKTSRLTVYGELNINGTQEEMVSLIAGLYNNATVLYTNADGKINCCYAKIENLVASQSNIVLNHCEVNYDERANIGLKLDDSGISAASHGCRLKNAVDCLFTFFTGDYTYVLVSGMFQGCVFKAIKGGFELYGHSYESNGETCCYLTDCTIINETNKKININLDNSSSSSSIAKYPLPFWNGKGNVMKYDENLLKMLINRGIYHLQDIRTINYDEYKQDRHDDIIIFTLNGKAYDIFENEIVIESCADSKIRDALALLLSTPNNVKDLYIVEDSLSNVFTPMNESNDNMYIYLNFTTFTSSEVEEALYEFYGFNTYLDNMNNNLLTNDFRNINLSLHQDKYVKNGTIKNAINTNFDNQEIDDFIISDGNDDPFTPTLGKTDQDDPMLERLWPYVKKCEFFDKDRNAKTVFGKELMIVRLTMNRDMDMTENIQVSFGSAAPYADYEITGKWIDTRTWEGSTFINASLENGKQSLNIYGGYAADDKFKTIQEPYGRLSFKIDTTAAMAKTITACPGDDGITLNWFQDEYSSDTIMGYNIYRAEKETGNYKRVNKHIIAPDQLSFLDKTIIPGEAYWYTFTIVLSDMTESSPAGRIFTISKDTMNPSIYHTPLEISYIDSPLKIVCTAKDNISVETAKVYYRSKGQIDYKVANMIKNNDVYTCTISNLELSLDGFEYYIEISDGTNIITSGTSTEPYFVSIRKGIAETIKGDIDNDGLLTVSDVQMMLKHIYGEILLDDEQFKRADFNGDGEIATAEALRLLQFINGKINNL